MYDRKQVSLCVLIALLTSIYSSSQEPVPDAADSARLKIASLTTSAAQELDADHLAKGNQFVEQILVLAKTNHLGNDPVFEQSMGVVMIAAMKSKGTNFLERALQIAETDTGDNATKLVCTYLGMVT